MDNFLKLFQNQLYHESLAFCVIDRRMDDKSSINLNQEFIFQEGCDWELGENEGFQLVPILKKKKFENLIVLREFTNNELLDYNNKKEGYTVDHVVSLKVVMIAFNQYLIKNNTMPINLHSNKHQQHSY
ncbi:hypothetical protein DICPUDRAFT_156793 [Dictyostelium purpureum]|uniref:Uncharacterized protein n=1 Tax=Dictyostelium purpureum TaxID=5786 RepID=F0ZXG4_DICPU|nr:uncharacterized protein DICPUDRAFT_156793 [Dictyostelium purpureum]EGC31358.1 hypothetical protein DICPUDRAFT_156793 [Dictyostelium purpureum]|eukprot:XP_003292106.1 hypothetical protein DICPUDRAFT_156793 [Dictyostelium purpureum]